MKKRRKAKSKSKKVVLIIVAVFVILGVIEFARHPDQYLNQAESVHTVSTQAPGTEAPAPTVAQENTSVQKAPAPTPWRENPLDVINLTPDQRIALYDELDAALLEMLSGPGANASAEEVERLSDAIVADIASKHGVTTEEADMIYSYAALGYLYDINPADIKVQYGDTLDVNIVGTMLIVKAKIDPSYSNEATINQNFINVQHLIEKSGCDNFTEIQYWAVADMTDGSEGKVISFTIDKATIKLIADGKLIGGMIRDYAHDLWILPSLQN